MKKWEAIDGLYEFTIEENPVGNFDVCINYLGDKTWLWFRSYQAARKHIKDEYFFVGRFKRV